MNSSNSPSVDELKKCLQDAGMYEEHMEREEMLSYYNAIKSSQNTAQQEDEQRNIDNTRGYEELKPIVKNVGNDDPQDFFNSLIRRVPKKVTTNEKPFSLKTRTNKNVESESNHNDDILDNLEVADNVMPQGNESSDAEQEVIDAFNCPPISHKPLDIVIHTPKYNLPLYCDPKLSLVSFEKRVNLIYNYHQNLLEKFYKFHCKSLDAAPWGKPIATNNQFNGVLDRKIYSFSKDNELLETNESTFDGLIEGSESMEVYTSRSGRQTKRKVYVEENMDDNSNKKPKKDEDEPFEIANKPLPKRQSLSKLSNSEIIKRSKIFGESSKSSRNEKIFDLLDDKKKKKAEKEIEDFKESLKDISDDDEISGIATVAEPVEIKPKEVSFLRRRVTPPVHGRKGIASRKPTTEISKNKSTEPAERSQSQSQEVTSSETSAAQVDRTKTQSNNEQKSNKKTTKCPICSECFFQTEIEEHASSCGLGMEAEATFVNITQGDQAKIKCNVCDIEMPMDTDYEVHVKDCLANAKSTTRI